MDIKDVLNENKQYRNKKRNVLLTNIQKITDALEIEIYKLFIDKNSCTNK